MSKCYNISIIVLVQLPFIKSAVLHADLSGISFMRIAVQYLDYKSQSLFYRIVG